MKYWLLIFAISMSCSRPSHAQVIFEPVKYQYGGRSPYYYGGHDPAVFAYAEAFTSEPGWGRSGGYAFHSADGMSHREVTHVPLRAFTDQLPYENAAIYGYTDVDARNQAYANVPRYFVKKDLIAAGRVETGDNAAPVIVVPAQAQPVIVTRGPLPAPVVPAAVLIIPTPQPAPQLVAQR